MRYKEIQFFKGRGVCPSSCAVGIKDKGIGEKIISAEIK